MPLVIKHEEGAVLAVVDLRNPKRSADQAAVLVLAQSIFWLACRARCVEIVLKVIFSIEFIVAEKLEHATVELIGAGLQCDCELRPGMGAVLRGVSARLHFEFLNRLGRRR